jgi:hypothetical protein
MILVYPWLFKLLVRKGTKAMALFPFILLRDAKLKQDTNLILHERIHLKQQLELLVLPFYVIYGVEFLIHLVRYKDSEKAYRNISFEREAYASDWDFEYLEKRKYFAMWRRSCGTSSTDS